MTTMQTVNERTLAESKRFIETEAYQQVLGEMADR